MIEKVNPSHPDKVADRIAGAIVDLAYTKSFRPKVAVEVLLGHGKVSIIIETSEDFLKSEIESIVKRIVKEDCTLDLTVVKQDVRLAINQHKEVRCGDNGIFKGVPLTTELVEMSRIAHNIYSHYPTDGKYILDFNDYDRQLIICQSNAKNSELKELFPEAIINPIGEWTGGYNVDTGATNRKLGSDMGYAVTGGGLHGKDLSKADVSVNIVCHLLAQQVKWNVIAKCAIGDKDIDFTYVDAYGQEVGNDSMSYKQVFDMAGRYVKQIGGFEKLAEWGLY